jgi:outer membrane protein OmpA-like peptidoglycan-associated protein
MRYKVISVAVAMLLAGGCAGKTTSMQMKDATGSAKEITFPKGTLLGTASKDQTNDLARIFVDSHNMAVEERGALKKDLEELKRLGAKSGSDQEAMAVTLARIEDLSRGSLETARKSLQLLEDISKRQGTGEITVFYPKGQSTLNEGSLEYERLVRFADYLARESRGRKIFFISIGSASAFGSREINERLAKERAEAPAAVVDRYLVNIPHEFHKVYGVGDLYSPLNVPMKEHERYQSTRLIAFFETGQLPQLPPE